MQVLNCSKLVTVLQLKKYEYWFVWNFDRFSSFICDMCVRVTLSPFVALAPLCMMLYSVYYYHYHCCHGKWNLRIVETTSLICHILLTFISTVWCSTAVTVHRLFFVNHNKQPSMWCTKFDDWHSEPCFLSK